MGNTVIVGGGTAGLAAAYTLERAGADYTVLEKRDFSGGRIYGTVRDGLTLDLGAQFMFTRYYTMFDLLDQMGLRDELVSWKLSAGIQRDGKFYYIRTDVRDAVKHFKETVEARKYLSTSGKLNAVKLGLDFAKIGRKLDFNDPLKAIELDDISFADYTRKKFGDEVLEYLQQPVVSALSLGQPEEVSAAYGMALGWYGVPGLATFKKGIGFLAESLKSRIKEVRLNTSVKRIVLEGKMVKGVEIESGGKTEVIEADNVICCTLAGEAAALLPDLPVEMLDVLNSIKYSACAHVMLGVPGRPLGGFYALVGPRKEGFSHAGITENAVKAPGYAPPDKGIIHVYTYADHAKRMLDMSDSEVLDIILPEIRQMVPTFPDPLFCEIFRWPQAVCLSRPGQIRDVQKLKVALRDYSGLYLAGEYFALPSVEGALTSGVKTAERLLY